MSVLIISDVGINHGGDENRAYNLVDAAIKAGVDVVKFQLFGKEYADGKYEHLRFSHEQVKRMEGYCKANGVGFACTAFSADELRWLLENTCMEFVKIGSGQHSDIELLTTAQHGGLPVIQSCTYGMSGLGGAKYLHVVPLYPTSPEKANLGFFANDIKTGHRHGLSCHSGDIFMPQAAVALGAKIIECHITQDKNQEGYDHKASLDPQQFAELVRGIRAIEKGLA